MISSLVSIDGRPVQPGLILLGGMGILSILCFDLLYSQYGLLGEAWPDVSQPRLLRSAVIFLSVVFIALGFTSGWPRVKLPLMSSDSSVEWMSTVAAMGLSVLFTVLFLVFPQKFSQWSLEDGPIEWGSALLLFCSSAILVLTLAKARRHASCSFLTTGLIALLALVFFVIAMEEVSWLQRVFDLRAPAAFGSNEQRELNFHNFATNRIENLYYFGAFLFLVVTPLARLFLPSIFSNTHIAPLAPAPFIAVIGALGCVYNFDMWNIAFTQIAFFASVVALVFMAVVSPHRNERVLLVCAVLLLVATQVAYLTNGEGFSRMWEVTEYKEFLIPLGFLAYSASVYRTMGKSAAP